MFASPPEIVCKYKPLLKVVALVPIALGLLIAAIAYNDPTTKMGAAWGISIAACAASSLFLWLLFTREEVVIYPDGMAHEGLFGRKEIRWESVVRTRFAQTTNAEQFGAQMGLLGLLVARLMAKRKNAGVASRQLTVYSRDGAKVQLLNFHLRANEAMHKVLVQVNPRLLSELRALIRQGSPVEFGKIAISAQGVGWRGKELLPFAQVESAELQGSRLVIRARGKRLNFLAIAAHRVPNVFVALDLIHEMVSGVSETPVQQMAFAATV